MARFVRESDGALTNPSERVLGLLAADWRPDEADVRHADVRHGYLDLLGGGGGPEPRGLGPKLMRSRVLPVVYERWWRPAWARVVRGARGGGIADEHRIARLLLALSPGDGVLDVACGPGNFTREFAAVVGPGGLAVGLDASPTMLARAVADTPGGEVAYVRGDAERLPFVDASFDAVCCFAALNLIADPFAALDEMARVLTPGGRIALFTSCQLRSAPGRAVSGLAATRTGMRMFGVEELVDALRARGFDDVRQQVHGLTQFVGGRLPA